MARQCRTFVSHEIEITIDLITEAPVPHARNEIAAMSAVEPDPPTNIAMSARDGDSAEYRHAAMD